VVAPITSEKKTKKKKHPKTPPPQEESSKSEPAVRTADRKEKGTKKREKGKCFISIC